MAANDQEVFEQTKQALVDGLKAQRTSKGLFFFCRKDPIIDPVLNQVAKTKDMAGLQLILASSDDSRIVEVARRIPGMGNISVALMYAD